MSGGVDSSVAAKIMVDRGYECIGCTMKLHNENSENDYDTNTCCSLKDVEDARSISNRLDMPYYVFNFQDDFEEKVINKFIECYQNGITPNPCIDCNKYMKFDKLYSRAKELDCDVIVTGHYCRIEKDKDRYVLKKALDDTKDQSYVLYSLTQEQLSHTVFPLGDLPKSQVRKIAEENGFINANKPDSQDICFVPDGDYASVIEKYTGVKSQEGDFVDTEGNVLGRHKGIIHYTLGQRKGLGLSFTEPRYVCEICPSKNQVVLGKNEDLFSRCFKVDDINWTSGEVKEKEIRCSAKVRYRHKEEPGVLSIHDNGKVSFVFDEPQRAITPGQSAVFYDGDIVLGGGIITEK